MTRTLRFGLALGFACGLAAGLPAADPKPATTPPKAPDWSKFIQVADIVGEVTKVEEKSIVLRVTWYAPQAPQGGNQNQIQRPQLTRPGQLPQMRRPNVPRPPQMKEMHADHELTFADEGLVRFNALPPKFDEKNKRVPYTPKELEELKKPAGIKGFAADRTDLKPGTLAEVVVVRPRDILPANAKEEDLRIKTLVILGEVAKPSAPPKEEKKKN